VTGLSLDTEDTFETPYTRRDNPYRAYITIMEGCGKSCSYCVVPLTRGPERSRTARSILNEVERLAGGGCTEIQLLGQNVNSYRDPSRAGGGFAELLDAVARTGGLRRVRFTTSHPRDFGKDIVDAIDANSVIANHVHLPVQCGSTKVLELMRRQYTREDYLERIAWIKAARRKIVISTDMIVGFPGETGADFAETLSLAEAVEFDSMFSFKYSPRPNTAALDLDGQVPEGESGARLTLLQEKQRAIQIQRHARLVGAVEEVMVEGHNQATGQWIGRTMDNRVLNFLALARDPVPRPGGYVRARVTRAGANSLSGEQVDLL
jgi:tRNA-2-methylthio-N6-dimethylallyladenosine synthase